MTEALMTEQSLPAPAVAANRAEACPTCGSDCNERDELIEAEREIERLRADLRVMEGFAELWCFVIDEAPLEFERIVNEWSPARWLGEAHKLMMAKRGA